MADDWGNPEHKTFARRFIRQVAVEEVRVKVHAALVPLVEKLLTDLHEQHLAIERVVGYPDAGLPLGNGLVLQVAGVPEEATDRAMLGYGFERQAESYVWAGTLEAARTVGVEAEQALDQQHEAALSEPAAPAAAVAELPDNWQAVLPGSRTLRAGCKPGRDVLFLQLLLQLPPTGAYDEATVEAVRHLRRKRGLRGQAVMDADCWRQLLPRTRPRLRRGDTGQRVRLASAALLASGVLDHTATRPHAVFGSAMASELRTWQQSQGLAVTGMVTTLDWERLLHHPWATV